MDTHFSQEVLTNAKISQLRSEGISSQKYYRDVGPNHSQPQIVRLVIKRLAENWSRVRNNNLVQSST